MTKHIFLCSDQLLAGWLDHVRDVNIEYEMGESAQRAIRIIYTRDRTNAGDLQGQKDGRSIDFKKYYTIILMNKRTHK
jgi:hypothetical protein